MKDVWQKDPRWRKDHQVERTRGNANGNAWNGVNQVTSKHIKYLEKGV